MYLWVAYLTLVLCHTSLLQAALEIVGIGEGKVLLDIVGQVCQDVLQLDDKLWHA